MTYELAKKLRQVGFPFKECELETCTYIGDSLDESGKNYHYPTLSELIEACGEKFGYLDKSKLGWIAGDNESKGVPYMKFVETPEEAVANLWLELNKK